MKRPLWSLSKPHSKVGHSTYTVRFDDGEPRPRTKLNEWGVITTINDLEGKLRMRHAGADPNKRHQAAQEVGRAAAALRLPTSVVRSLRNAYHDPETPIDKPLETWTETELLKLRNVGPKFAREAFQRISASSQGVIGGTSEFVEPLMTHSCNTVAGRANSKAPA